jgi:hypothetical protein
VLRAPLKHSKEFFNQARHNPDATQATASHANVVPPVVAAAFAVTRLQRLDATAVCVTLPKQAE